MDIVSKIGVTKTDNGDKPLKQVVITESGILPLEKPFKINDNPNK